MSLYRRRPARNTFEPLEDRHMLTSYLPVDLQVNSIAGTQTILVTADPASDITRVDLFQSAVGADILLREFGETPNGIGVVNTTTIPLDPITSGLNVTFVGSDQVDDVRSFIFGSDPTRSLDLEINGVGGDDRLQLFNSGDFTPRFGSADISLNGGAGNDTLVGDEFNNFLEGGDGDDLIYGLAGDDDILATRVRFL